MSVSYEMTITVTDQIQAREKQIIDSANAEWDSFTGNWSNNEYSEDGSERLITAWGVGNLHSETDEQFASRLAKAIFIANGASCSVKVCAVYVENAPFEEYEYGEEDYEEMFGQKGKQDDK